MNEDDALKLRRAEGIRRKFQDPKHRAKMAEVARRNGQKAAADPAHHQWLVEHGKELYAKYLAPLQPGHSPEARAKAGRKRTETVLGWCPPELRALHRRNTISKRMRAADSRAMIEKMVADREAIRSGHLDDALFWLNRIAPVKRLDDGTYRYGSAILTPGQLIDRAKLKGWHPMDMAA
jgi:hypothetical protein